MTPNPDCFKGTPLFDVESQKQYKTDIYNGMLIGTYTCPTQR